MKALKKSVFEQTLLEQKLQSEVRKVKYILYGSNIFVFGGLKTTIYLKATLKREKVINRTNEEVTLQSYCRNICAENFVFIVYLMNHGFQTSVQ